MTLTLGQNLKDYGHLRDLGRRNAPSKTTRWGRMNSKQEIGQADTIPFFTAYWINPALVRRFRSSMIRYL